MSKRLLTFVLVVTGCAGNAPIREAAEVPTRRGTASFLQELTGNWDYVAEAMKGPGLPVQRLEGVERGRMVGRWLVLETDGQTPSGRFAGVLTLGPGAGDEPYVGTWISSVEDTLVQYQGRLDETGRVLTLETVGPDPGEPAKQIRYRDVIELIDADRKEVASMMEVDGTWTTFLSSHHRRRR